jgi:hypothetical protein
MTLRGKFRLIRRRAGRALRPRRLFGSAFLLAATGVAILLLVRVVSEASLNPTAGAPTTAPKVASPTTVPTTKATAPKVATTGPRPRHQGGAQPVGTTVPLGVYAGPGAVAQAGAFTLEAGAPVPYAFDYLDGTSWETIADPAWFIERWNDTGYRMIWGVPMLPSGGGATMAAGAAGLYNSYFQELATVLVGEGQGDSLIVLGWDPGAPNVPWAATSPQTAAEYIAYWRQVVTAMRSVAGAQFEFVWDAAAGYGVAPSALYPGNADVDVVATDAFDVGAGVVAPSWDELATAAYGPDWFASFAAAHKKPLMIAKWGVVPSAALGGGDDPTFVNQFLRWADKEHVLAAVVWDDGSWGLTNGAYPKSASMLHTVAAEGAVRPLAKAVGA